jgi:recombination protein RecA
MSTPKYTLTQEGPLETGYTFIDHDLGGVPKGAITHIYGPAGVGKSTLAMQIYLGVAKRGVGCFVIDCGQSYSPRRLLQLSTGNPPLSHITVFQPKTFREQGEIIGRLHRFVDSRLGVIVVDPITSYYRQRVTHQTKMAMYRQLAEHQVPRLLGLARDYGVAVVLVNQITSWDGAHKLVGGDAIHRYTTLEVQMERLETTKSENRWIIAKQLRGEKSSRRILVKLELEGFQTVKVYKETLLE